MPRTVGQQTRGRPNTRTNVWVGSAFRDRFRIFLPVEVTLKVDCGKKRRAGEKRHYFSWEDVPSAEGAQPARRTCGRQNPVRLAREWQASLSERGESRADLARRLGISRARVTQVLSVLDFDPDVLELLEQQTGPSLVSERALRKLTGLSSESQRELLATWFAPSLNGTGRS